MARDCPDRQRGADWRNGPQGGTPGQPSAGRIGGGDAVDREYEVSCHKLYDKSRQWLTLYSN